FCPSDNDFQSTPKSGRFHVRRHFSKPGSRTIDLLDNRRNLRRKLSLTRHRHKASDLNEPPSGLARRLLPTDHRKNRPSEISSRFHQLICASSLKFVSGTITPEHAKTAHSNRMGTGDV